MIVPFGYFLLHNTEMVSMLNLFHVNRKMNEPLGSFHNNGYFVYLTTRHSAFK